MSGISEIYRVRQRAIEYAIKHNNSKAAVKYKTSRQQIKRWRDRCDSTVQSLLPKSRRPKSHPNQHTQEEIELVMKKYRKCGYEALAEVYVKARKEGYSRTYDSMCKIIKKIKGNAKEKIKSSIKEKRRLNRLSTLGIEYGTTRPYSPWENGKVERSHRLDSKYYADKKFKSKEELLRSIKKYNTRYNNISRKVLGFKSPNEVLKECK